MDRTDLAALLVAERATLLAIARREAFRADPSAVDDLFQTATERALKGAAGFDGENLGGWFRIIVRSARRDLWRSEAREQRRVERVGTCVGYVVMDDDQSESPSYSPDDEVRSAPERHASIDEYADPALAAAVRAAFASLPDKQRRVAQAVLVDGLSYAEAADRLGIPKGTVMSSLHRARATLQAALAAHVG